MMLIEKTEILESFAEHHDAYKKNKCTKRWSLLKIRRRLNTKINICKCLKPIGHEEKLEKYNRKNPKIVQNVNIIE